MAWIVRWTAAVLALCSASAASAAPPLSVYGNLPGFERAAISPSGDRYAVVGVLGDKRSLIVANLENKALVDIAVGDNKVRRIAFADNNHLIIWISGTEHLGPDFTVDLHELTAVAVVTVNNGKIRPIMNSAPVFGGVSGYFGSVSEKGHLYSYFSAITIGRTKMAGDNYWESGVPDLYRVDLDNGNIRLFAKHPSYADSRDWVLDSSGNIAATLDFSDAQGKWWLRNAAGDEIAKGVARLGEVDLLGLGRTPGTVAYAVGDEGRHVEWLESSTPGTQPVQLFPDMATQSVELDPATHQIIGYVEDNDRPQTHFLDAYREARMRSARKTFAGLGVEFISASSDFNRLIVKTEGDGDSGSWWLIDIKTRAANPIGASYPLVKAADVAPVRMVDYKAADGLALHGVLTLPPGRPAHNLPLVMLPHGGPAARDYPGFDWWAQALASRGYAVFQPNFRGSTGYGSAFQRAGDGEWGGKMQTDISDAIGELARQGIADPKRVCIVGASYGGYAALAGVTLQHGLYRCAVSVAGLSDMSLLINGEKRGSDNSKTLTRSWRVAMGTVRKPESISPVAFAASADAPILLIHGTGDTVVPFEQSQVMLARLKKAGKPVEMVVLAGEDHWLSRGETRQAMLNATVGFLERYNPPN